MVDVTSLVPDLASDQGERTVSTRLLTIPNVEAVVVDLETKGVTVHGRELDTIALRATIESAGGIPSGLNEVERLSGLGRLDAFAPGPPVAGRGRSRNAHDPIVALRRELGSRADHVELAPHVAPHGRRACSPPRERM